MKKLVAASSIIFISIILALAYAVPVAAQPDNHASKYEIVNKAVSQIEQRLADIDSELRVLKTDLNFYGNVAQGLTRTVTLVKDVAWAKMMVWKYNVVYEEAKELLEVLDDVNNEIVYTEKRERWVRYNDDYDRRDLEIQKLLSRNPEDIDDDTWKRINNGMNEYEEQFAYFKEKMAEIKSNFFTVMIAADTLLEDMARLIRNIDKD